MAKTKGGYLSAQDVLWIMVFFGFAVNYMIRVNINIAIVEMARRPDPSWPPGDPANGERRVALPASAEAEAACAVRESVREPANFSLSPTLNSDPPLNLSAAVTPTAQAQTTPQENPEQTSDETRGMNEYEQGLVLGAFFWLFWLSQVPGGVLASRYGTKIVFGVANAFPGVLGMLIPVVAPYGVWPVVVVRLLQGLIAGCTWPSMHHLTAQWVPPDKRSKFVTAYLGSSFGAALTFPACGSLMSWLGWPAVFYASGFVSVVWAAAWWVFVFDTPAHHPRISLTERATIDNALRDQIHSAKSKARLPTPWKAIFSSVPVWVNICAQWGAIWALFTLLTQAPTYFRRIHGWGIQMTGLLSGLPHICRIFFAIIVSHVGDWLIRSNKMSRTNVRKAATGLCNVGMGVFTLALAWSGCNATAAVIFVILATAANGAVSTGALASIVDLSPNFASIVFGVCGLVTVFPGFISPYIVGLLTLNNQTTTQWSLVYLIAGLMSIVSGILFIIFSDSEVQSWNSPKDEKTQELKFISNGSSLNATKYHQVSKGDKEVEDVPK